jgi:regulator of protease activity HflC (stomatin/prohibitin superfamily)
MTPPCRCSGKAGFGFKIITQYEQGIVFRWGRALPGIRQPGLTWVNPFTDRLRKVNMQITVADIPALAVPASRAASAARNAPLNTAPEAGVTA